MYMVKLIQKETATTATTTTTTANKQKQKIRKNLQEKDLTPGEVKMHRKFCVSLFCSW